MSVIKRKFIAGSLSFIFFTLCISLINDFYFFNSYEDFLFYVCVFTPIFLIYGVGASYLTERISQGDQWKSFLLHIFGSMFIFYLAFILVEAIALEQLDLFLILIGSIMIYGIAVTVITKKRLIAKKRVWIFFWFIPFLVILIPSLVFMLIDPTEYSPIIFLVLYNITGALFFWLTDCLLIKIFNRS
ncbi:hypothetical protein [Mechercharimyces sp. CAU 1602]|uniref:hypothetical protein n=1 Tax=Mechercharimyces sp. CAU 1602 TaxID=2973933 RepID=UPI0021611CE7|nr:hypothetical protein [Mechercharimyces sp. CAU 1602]MCS1351514.1 hypothetical protein [Mechercharimyces sp. CAU 1602]